MTSQGIKPYGSGSPSTEPNYLMPRARHGPSWNKYQNLHNIPQSYGYTGNVDGLVQYANLKIHVSGYNYSETPMFFTKGTNDQIIPMQSFHNTRAMTYTFVMNGTPENIQIYTSEPIMPTVNDVLTNKCYTVKRAYSGTYDYNDPKGNGICLDSPQGAELYTVWNFSV